MPAVGEHSTAKNYVDQTLSISVDEHTLLRDNQYNDFKIFNLTITICVTLKTQAVNDNEVNTKA